jgi:hypothetical protein
MFDHKTSDSMPVVVFGAVAAAVKALVVRKGIN